MGKFKNRDLRRIEVRGIVRKKGGWVHISVEKIRRRE